MVTLVTANLVNAAACWVLIFGHCGFPALGAEGAGWATCIARVYMLLGLARYVWWVERRRRRPAWPLRFDAARLREIIRLGLPAALQMLLEVGVFATAAVLAGRLDRRRPRGAPGRAQRRGLHASWCRSASPPPPRCGSARRSAASTRVGAARAGWTALLLAAGFMCGSALLF